MLNPHFKAMLSALREEGVEFLVVGAYELAAHGVPRATGDLDFWVRTVEENAERLMRALDRFGAPTDGLSAQAWSCPRAPRGRRWLQRPICARCLPPATKASLEQYGE